MLDVFTLDVFWYLIVGVSMIFYAVLDGFDLGVGMLHLFAKTDQDRRIFLNAIGPVWDGNEVWLVIVAGALFAGFPDVYATLLSSFYNLVMILLVGLIFRAVAIEFRSKHASSRWRSTWDVIFALASFVIAFGVGVSLGNLVEGIPIDASLTYQGTFMGIFRPYAVLVGITSVALFMMHGAIYLLMKTEGAIHDKVRRFVRPCIAFFLSSYAVTTAATLVYMPHMIAAMRSKPYLFAFALLALVCLIIIPRLVYKQRDGLAFIFSSLGISLLLIVFGIGMYPTLVRSSLDPEAFSLTITNAASSPLTLKVLAIIVAIGVPLVLAYGFLIYRIFRGKVKIGPGSY